MRWNERKNMAPDNLPVHTNSSGRFIVVEQDAPQTDPLADQPGSSLIAVIRQPLLFGLYAILAFFVFGGLWAWQAPIAGAVIVAGTLKQSSDPAIVQHKEGGIVDNVLVREGDIVEKGQTIVVLDNAELVAQREASQQRLFKEELKLERLRAEKNESDILDFSRELTGRLDGTITNQWTFEERNLFLSRKRLREEDVRVTRNKISQIRIKATANKKELNRLQKQLQLISEEEEATQLLLDKGLTPRPKLLAIQRRRLEIQASIERFQGELNIYPLRIAELENETVRRGFAFFETVDSEIVGAENLILDLKSRLVLLNDRISRTVIRASVPGKVINMEQLSPGSVVSGSGRILEIAPQSNDFVVEVRIEPRDIDDISVGQDAELVFEAFPVRSMPRIDGILANYSSDTLFDERTRAPYYWGQVAFDFNPPASAGVTKEDLYAGMPVQVFLRTRDLTLLQYLIEPLLWGLDNSFRSL